MSALKFRLLAKYSNMYEMILNNILEIKYCKQNDSCFTTSCLCCEPYNDLYSHGQTIKN